MLLILNNTFVYFIIMMLLKRWLIITSVLAFFINFYKFQESTTFLAWPMWKGCLQENNLSIMVFIVVSCRTCEASADHTMWITFCTSRWSHTTLSTPHESYDPIEISSDSAAQHKRYIVYSRLVKLYCIIWYIRMEIWKWKLLKLLIYNIYSWNIIILSIKCCILRSCL